MSQLNTYKVSYSGNSTRFSDFSQEVNATSEREAVIKVYGKFLDSNYFPQEDGTIQDCDGNQINDGITDNYIEYDGGSFSAELID